jgi:hypothetical protein
LNDPSSEVRIFLAEVVAGTKYEHRIIINDAPQEPEDIVVLFLGREANWWWPRSQFRDNCKALSGELTIVCDSDFFSTYLEKVLGTPAGASMVMAFQAWVLGHELGHIAHGHQDGHFGDDHSPSRDELRNLEQQRKEYAADCWMIQRLLAVQDTSRILEVERIAIDLVNSRVREITPNPPAGVGIIFDYNRVDPYDFRALGSHPDMMLRATRLLHVSAEERNDTGLQGMMAPLIRKLVPDPLWDEQGPCARQAR